MNAHIAEKLSPATADAFEDTFGIRPLEEQLGPARANFAVLLVRLERLDWLHLAHDGHRRAQFQRQDSTWHGRWCAP